PSPRRFPYTTLFRSKFVTWASGIVGIPVVAFLVCMAIGRAKRVYLLALLIRLFGKRAEEIMHKHIERFGWVVLVLLVVLGVWWRSEEHTSELQSRFE